LLWRGAGGRDHGALGRGARALRSPRSAGRPPIGESYPVGGRRRRVRCRRKGRWGAPPTHRGILPSGRRGLSHQQRTHRRGSYMPAGWQRSSHGSVQGSAEGVRRRGGPPESQPHRSGGHGLHGPPTPPPLGLASSRRGGAAQIPEGESCGLGPSAEEGRGGLLASSKEAESSGIPRQRRAVGADSPLWGKAAAAYFSPSRGGLQKPWPFSGGGLQPPGGRRGASRSIRRGPSDILEEE